MRQGLFARSLPCLLTVLLAPLAAPPRAHAQDYVYQRIYVGDVFVNPETGEQAVVPTGVYPLASAVNNSNFIAGSYMQTARQPPASPPYRNSGLHGWVWDRASFDRNIAEEAPLNLYGMNDAKDLAGEIEALRCIGTSCTIDGSSAYLEINGAGTTFDRPAPCHYTTARAINNAGQVVGYCNARGAGGRGAFVPSSGFMRGADGTFTAVQVPGFPMSAPYGINDVGSIVGTYVDGIGQYHGFYYDGPSGTWTALNVIGATHTEARGLNNVGQIVGLWWSANPTQVHGFVWDGATFTNIDFPRSPGGPMLNTRANAINDYGVVVGDVADSAGDLFAFVAVP